MPTYKSYTLHQLQETLKQIGGAVYAPVAALDIRAWWSTEPLPFDARTTGDALHLEVGDKWGDLFDCAWFRFTGTVPEAAAGKHVVLLLDVNGEMCVFDEKGHPQQGLTCVASGYDFSLGAPGKRVLELTPQAAGGEPVEVWADAGCNDLFGNLQGNGTVREASIAVCHDATRALYYDFEVLFDFLSVLDIDSPRYQQILTGLNDVAHLWFSAAPAYVDGLDASAAQETLAVGARAILAPLLAKRGGDPSLEISAVGHAHMDLGWLWPIRETKRKGARTFSTALKLIARYPDYVFGASQPQYWLWMKEAYPDLYARIKDAVATGRIEPQGAMWVEADTNVSGGEALVRQLLLGKRFWRDEFGVDMTYLWLPDVFGYNAALPQILRLAGVDLFSTQKLSWSLINPFPHQSFHWQGIDGTRILTHMLPEETYNSPAAPRSVRKIERNYHDSGVSSQALMVFGIGDGGGGPGEEHLERLARIRDLAGLSPVRQESAAALFERLASEAGRFATWVGELYLERHEGTLTTEARNKWYNRKMELGLRELEWTAVLATAMTDAEYPTNRLRDLWRETLLYQFHDILPGSSIKRVYDESLARYAVMLEEVERRIDDLGERISARIDTRGAAGPVVVRNSLAWQREEWLQIEDAWHKVTVPGMGYTVVDAAAPTPEIPPVTATANALENDLVRVTFADDGTIVSFYDKRLSRETLQPGERANRLLVFRDPGDAWDFPMDYAEQTPQPLTLVSQTPHADGPIAVMSQAYEIGHSTLTQDVILRAGSPQLDFVSKLTWRETQTMLRTRFPIAVHTDTATFEIQFGSLRRPTHRNTTWDLARDEVAAHRWVDVSEAGYGVALLNDSKYGHKVKDDGHGPVIDLNLLRSAPYPGPRLVEDADVAPGEPHHGYTDQTDHVFTYALYPHPGDHVAGGVLPAAHALNAPLRFATVAPQEGALPATGSFLSVDRPNIVIEAVKRAEDGTDVIVRLYEAAERTTEATVRLGIPASAVEVVNLMEEEPHSVALVDGAVTLSFHPFEIKTLRIKG